MTLFSRGCGCCSEIPSNPGRRRFMAGAAALSAGAVLGRPALAQTPPAKTKIDVHHHFTTQFHTDAMMAPGRRVGGNPPKWSPALSIEDMDKSGIATSILSISQPG